MREFVVIFCVVACLIGACCQIVKERDGDKGYPREVYNNPNLGSIVMMNDSIAVVFIVNGLNKSLSQVVNIKDINREVIIEEQL